jgi:hypothetical protein
MGGRQELFGICADAVFETGAEGILSVLQGAAIGGDISLAGFQVTLPNCGSFALHFVSFGF